jgi:hypothetical protein
MWVARCGDTIHNFKDEESARTFARKKMLTEVTHLDGPAFEKTWDAAFGGQKKRPTNMATMVKGGHLDTRLKQFVLEIDETMLWHVYKKR